MGKSVSKYSIKLKRKLDEIRHPAIFALKGKKIGPLFPTDDTFRYGMYGLTRKATKKGAVRGKLRFVSRDYREKRRAKKKMTDISRRRNGKT